MSLGERAALEGILNQLKPGLSFQIGAGDGGSLRCTASHSTEVHSFDLVAPEDDVTSSGNVVLHTGRSRELLPVELARCAEQGKNLDFVLVDGEHSGEDVRWDVEDLLNSPAVQRTVILVTGTVDEAVRRGLDAIHYEAWPKVERVDLDFVSGRMFKDDGRRGELRGGLGLLLIDATRHAYSAGTVIEDRYYEAGHLLAEMHKQIEERMQAAVADTASSADGGDEAGGSADEELLVAHITELESKILHITSVSSHHEAVWRGMQDSASWRLTRPLRGVATLARRVRGQR